MSKRALTILIASVVAVGGGAAAVAASISGGDDGPATTMPAGQHQMNDGEMMGEQMMEDDR